MIRTIIVDDEQHCIDRLSGMLTGQFQDSVELIAARKSVSDGIEAVRSLQPDLVFLDVQLGDHTGFDLLKQLPETHFEVIFTTAFEQYAVQAFKFSAIDYLLKPVDVEDLRQAIGKLKEKISKEETAKKLDVLFHNLKNLEGVSKRISVPTVNGLVFLQVSDIIRCEADVNYTHIFSKERQKITVARTLKEFEMLLIDYNFYRVHHSHLVNLSHIKRYDKGKGGYITMIDNSEIEVSTRRKEEFLKRLSQL